MSNHNYFELQRLSDDTVYQFERLEHPNGSLGYKRKDKDLWITYDSKLGWIAPHPETDEIAGKPWNVLPSEQSEHHPPEGEWVSKKGVKSYVYRLIYTTKDS